MACIFAGNVSGRWLRSWDSKNSADQPKWLIITTDKMKINMTRMTKMTRKAGKC